MFVVEGYRQAATAPFHRLTGSQILLNGDAASTRQGGLCLADSGSPHLLAGTNLALSLFSTGAAEVDACRGLVQAQRLDTRSERRFLARKADHDDRSIMTFSLDRGARFGEAGTTHRVLEGSHAKHTRAADSCGGQPDRRDSGSSCGGQALRPRAADGLRAADSRRTAVQADRLDARTRSTTA